MINSILLTIGDELLDGRIINSNQAFLGQHAQELGCSLSEAHSLPDDLELLVSAIKAYTSRCDVLLISGGLGPTTDDLTREAVAKACEQDLILSEAAKEHILAMFKKINIPMANINLRQAYMPKNAKLIDNPNGTAPGLYVKHNTCHIFCLPGVPRELKPMVKGPVSNTILKQFKGQLEKKEIDCYKCFGIGESSLGKDIEAIPNKPKELDILYRAHFPELHVSLRYQKALASDSSFQHWKKSFEALVDPYLFSTTEADFIDSMQTFFKDNTHQLVVSESCTGGLISQLLCSKAGASDFFVGSVVSYANEAKSRLCGVDPKCIKKHGAVSEETAKEMAKGLLSQFPDATVALATTGIAGPDGGSDEKPVGTVYLGFATQTETHTKQVFFPGSRNRIQSLSAYAALQFCKNKLNK